MMKFDMDSLTSTCGVGVLYSFTDSPKGFGYTLEELEERGGDAGCGWYVVGFIDTPTCHTMYQECCEKLELVYQSPVRRNINSNNDFFFCIFDVGQPKEEFEDDDDF